MAAMKMPKDSDEAQAARQAALEEATRQALMVPLEVARKAVQVMELAAQVATLGNINALSDAGSGATMARAALTAGGLNVRTNALSLQDQSFAEPMLEELAGLEARAAEVEGQMRQTLIDRGRLPL